MCPYYSNSINNNSRNKVYRFYYSFRGGIYYLKKKRGFRFLSIWIGKKKRKKKTDATYRLLVTFLLFCVTFSSSKRSAGGGEEESHHPHHQWTGHTNFSPSLCCVCFVCFFGPPETSLCHFFIYFPFFLLNSKSIYWHILGLRLFPKYLYS